MKKRNVGPSNASNKKENPILGLIVIAIFVAIIFNAISGGKKSESSTKNTVETSQQQANSQTEVKQLSQSASEKYCEDASLLGKYTDLSKTSIVKATAYNNYFNDSGAKAPNGNTIYDFQWNGENKETNESILFVCSVSGTDDNITLHSLAINGQVVYGPVDQQ